MVKLIPSECSVDGLMKCVICGIFMPRYYYLNMVSSP